MITSTEFRSDCTVTLNRATIQGYRAGQHVFNCLREVRPDIANEIVNTEFDPFYDNDRLPDFWKKVEELW